MEWKIFPTEKELGRAAAGEIRDVLKEKPDALLCLAAGHSSLCVFEEMVRMQNAGEADFSRARIVGLDEWSGMGREDDGSCAGFLWKNLFSRLPIPEGNIRLFDGLCRDREAECRRIEAHIRERGGIDYILLGIGMNGHLALNEPGTDFSLGAHVAALSETTKTVGQKYFENPTPLSEGITLGIRNITESRRITLVINGERKQDITAALFSSEITPALPATALKLAGGAKVFADRAAAQKILREGLGVLDDETAGSDGFEQGTDLRRA